MGHVTRFIQVLALTILCAQTALAVPILVRNGTTINGEGGYGSPGWSQITSLLDSATGNQVTVANDFLDNNAVQGSGALWVNTGALNGSTNLLAAEIANIVQFAANGGRVVLFGENTSWTSWNNNILSVVGGTQAGGATGVMSAVLAHELTNLVTSINVPAGAAAAVGGTALFSQNVATLWGAGNVLTFLDSNTLQDAFINNADNLQFGRNLAAWAAADVQVQVPEPGTLALFGMGLFGIGMSRRIRKA